MQQWRRTSPSIAAWDQASGNLPASSTEWPESPESEPLRSHNRRSTWRRRSTCGMVCSSRAISRQCLVYCSPSMVSRISSQAAATVMMASVRPSGHSTPAPGHRAYSGAPFSLEFRGAIHSQGRQAPSTMRSWETSVVSLSRTGPVSTSRASLVSRTSGIEPCRRRRSGFSA